MKVVLISSRYGPPWNEGSKNIVRVLKKLLPDFGFKVVVCPERNDRHEGGSHKKSTISLFINKPFFWWKAAKKARDERAGVIHMISSISSILGIKCFFIRSISGVPLVLHLTGLEKPIYGYKFLLKAECIIVGGNYLKRFAPNSFNFPPISPHFNSLIDKRTDRKVVCDNPARILYLGAMEIIRGVHTLVDALEVLKTRFNFRDFTVTLAWNGYGDLNYAQSIKKRIEERGIEQNVRWMESVEDVPALYQDHDIVVIPRAFRERMAFPLRLIESMSYGKPLVVSDMGEMLRIAEGCGLVFPHGSSEALASALHRLLSDRDFYNECVEICYQKASQYHPLRTVGRLAGLYKEVGFAG